MVKDPLKYFRLEANELAEGIGRGILELEQVQGGNVPEIVARLLRLAHTLKGAARVVKQTAIAESAHKLETALAPIRQSGAPVDSSALKELLAISDAMAALVRDLAAPPAPVPVAVAQAAEAVAVPVPLSAPSNEPVVARTLRADLAEMDALVDGVAEANVHLASVRQAVVDVERAARLAQIVAEQIEPSATALGLRLQARELSDLLAGIARGITSNVDQVERELEQVRDSAENLRLVPVSSLFAALERTARDASVQLGKKVVFRTSGGHVRLDADVLGVVQGALVQAVRNSVAHGIEPEHERLRADKAPFGTILLTIERQGDRVIFDCRDDGRGIDLDAVRKSANARGVLRADAQPTRDELLRLLLQGGVSTSRAVTEVAGRGVGLDVVREVATRLGGTIDLQTESGRGAGVRLVVPISLSSFEALVVEVSGVSAAIPLDAIRRTMRVGLADVADGPTGPTLLFEGSVTPFVPLARAMSLTTTDALRLEKGRAVSAIVLRGKNAAAALAVDRLVGRATIVMRRLSALTPAHAVVAGAALDSEGNPRIVLEPELLVEAAHAVRSPNASAGSTAQMPILVIDDSLTTRMLEQSILESAGYEVDVATSAEEGLERARQRRYGLILVDVEMPGMDGFGFIETIRKDNDPLLRALPAILVTSRNAPEDKQRGIDVGAHGYVVKSEFDQTSLVSLIERLIPEQAARVEGVVSAS